MEWTFKDFKLRVAGKRGDIFALLRGDNLHCCMRKLLLLTRIGITGRYFLGIPVTKVDHMQ